MKDEHLQYKYYLVFRDNEYLIIRNYKAEVRDRIIYSDDKEYNLKDLLKLHLIRQEILKDRFDSDILDSIIQIINKEE